MNFSCFFLKEYFMHIFIPTVKYVNTSLGDEAKVHETQSVWKGRQDCCTF